jgi:hypothetical protein
VTRYLAPADPGAEVDPGVEGNSRITASTGMVLTVLLLIEGFTILDVRGYITLHTVIGLMLIGPLALKCATTVYRFARYYSGSAAYVRRGPPYLVLRLIGPLVVVSSLAVVGTGIALLAAHGRSDAWLTLHQASFIVWISITGIHFLGHLYEAAVGTARDLRARPGDPAARGRTIRLLAVGAALVVGIAAAAMFTPSASSWQMSGHSGDHGRITGGR